MNMHRDMPITVTVTVLWTTMISLNLAESRKYVTVGVSDDGPSLTPTVM